MLSFTYIYYFAILFFFLQILTANILRDLNNTDPTIISQALTTYFSSISGPNVTLTSDNTLTVSEIDYLIGELTDISFVGSTSSSFLIVQPIFQSSYMIQGASFVRYQGGELITDLNQNNITNSLISAAAVINNASLSEFTYLSMLIIDDPSAFYYVNSSSNKTLASSIIVVSLNANSSLNASIDISLSFMLLNNSIPNLNTTSYYCSFYDTNNSEWSESGCTTSTYNSLYNRFDCSCNHLTSFALLASPRIVNVTTTTSTTTTTTTTSMTTTTSTTTTTTTSETTTTTSTTTTSTSVTTTSSTTATTTTSVTTTTSTTTTTTTSATTTTTTTSATTTTTTTSSTATIPEETTFDLESTMSTTSTEITSIITTQATSTSTTTTTTSLISTTSEISTSTYEYTTDTTTMITTAPPFNPDTCNDTDLIEFNNTCMLKSDVAVCCLLHIYIILLFSFFFYRS